MAFGDFSSAPVVDAASEITARLHLYRRNLLLGPATGFFKKLNNQVFLITNWHVVMGRHQETKQVLHSKAAIPDRLKFRVPIRDRPGEWTSPIEWLLYQDSESTESPEKSMWCEHPEHRDRLDIVAIPILGFLLFFVLRSWNSATDLQPGHFDFAAGWTIVKNYLPMLAFCWVLFQFGKAMPGRTLFIFSATIVALLVVAVVMGGKLAMWCVVGIGLFTSIGWPNIFSLALDRMGVLKGQVSSLLVMAVVGGALLPPLQGKIADILLKGGNEHGLQISFIVPMIAYAYVAFYGLIGHRIGRGKIAAEA